MKGRIVHSCPSYVMHQTYYSAGKFTRTLFSDGASENWRMVVWWSHRSLGLKGPLWNSNIIYCGPVGMTKMKKKNILFSLIFLFLFKIWAAQCHFSAHLHGGLPRNSALNPRFLIETQGSCKIAIFIMPSALQMLLLSDFCGVLL
jgi:hypothetical protein